MYSRRGSAASALIDVPRHFRVPLFPLTPLVFLGITGFMMYYLVSERPLQSLASLGLMVSGLLLFFLSRRDPLRDADLERAIN